MRERNLRVFKFLLFGGFSFVLSCLFGAGISQSATLNFSGKTWNVKSGSNLGPGPNNWSEQNVWVDSAGNLHLRISYSSGKWQCAEVWTEDLLGFGSYEWFVDGRIDQLDKNVALGLFNYGGTDNINEIDIEFAKWGVQKNKIGNFVVYPAQLGLSYVTFPFAVSLTGTATTHRFMWNYNSVMFKSLNGWQTDDSNMIYEQLYSPLLYGMYIPQIQMPVHINLWLFKGRAPSNGKPIEVVIKKFSFTQY
jgi:hypothetical protein